MNQLFTCAKRKFEDIKIYADGRVSIECVPEVVSNWFGRQWHVFRLPLDTDAFIWEIAKKKKKKK